VNSTLCTTNQAPGPSKIATVAQRAQPYLNTTPLGELPLGSPFLSVIINNYNYAAFLGQAIDSCLNQTYDRYEIIVVDDGSQDDSAAIMGSYGDRIIPVLKPNGGQASALNAGFAASRGEVIVLLDADDYLFRHALSTIATAWQRGRASEIAQLQCRLNLVDSGGEPIDLYPAPEITFDQGDVRSQLCQRGRYRTTVTSGLSFHRRVLAEILPIPEGDFRISADGYLVSVAPFYGPVSAVETAIGARRKHQNNVWAPLGKAVCLSHLHNSIHHDFLRYQYLSRAAGETLTPQNLGLGDHLHLMARLPSCRLSLVEHPCPGDRPAHLAIRGIQALWQQGSSYKVSRKLILSGWFLWVGLVPGPWVRPAVDWLLVSGSRPSGIDRLLKLLRRLTR
jgi:hypothetical protein